jgi:hypothetical protein
MAERRITGKAINRQGVAQAPRGSEIAVGVLRRLGG